MCCFIIATLDVMLGFLAPVERVGGVGGAPGLSWWWWHTAVANVIGHGVCGVARMRRFIVARLCATPGFLAPFKKVGGRGQCPLSR